MLESEAEMLQDLSDVQNYTKRVASTAPDLAAEIILNAIGVSEDDLARLADKIGLPPIYRSCAAAWNLYGVSIGYFGLWPDFGTKSELVSALLEVNQNSGEAAALAHSRGLVIVAREEANWICVGNALSDHPDVVFYMSTMASLERKLTEIANNFDHFVILAANLHDIAYSGWLSFEDGIEAMSNCCAAVGCNRSQAEFWGRKASELLA